MLNGLWSGMILIGIVWAVFEHTMGAVGEYALQAAGDAVSLCITMAGVMSLWSGLMEVAKEAAILNAMTKKMQPVLHFLFPRIPEGHPSLEAIAFNFTANILGLGWAATPAGIRAMECLSCLEEERRMKNMEEEPESKEQERAASDEMCTFLVLNISSLQLIPVNIIAYRTQYGSGNPGGIIGPGLAATAISTLASVLFIKGVTNFGRFCGMNKRKRT